MERCGNKRPRVQKLVSAWNQGIRGEAVSESGVDDPLIGASTDPSKRPRTRAHETGRWRYANSTAWGDNKPLARQCRRSPGAQGEGKTRHQDPRPEEQGERSAIRPTRPEDDGSGVNRSSGTRPEEERGRQPPSTRATSGGGRHQGAGVREGRKSSSGGGGASCTPSLLRKDTEDNASAGGFSQYTLGRPVSGSKASRVRPFVVRILSRSFRVVAPDSSGGSLTWLSPAGSPRSSLPTGSFLMSSTC